MDLDLFGVYISGGVEMQKIILKLLIPILSLNGPLTIVGAQEAPQPYLVTQFIPNETIPMEECVIILQNPLEEVNESSTDNTIYTAQEAELLLQSLQDQFNQLNYEISQLESGDTESLDWANSQLMLVIESIYEDYAVYSEDFIYLSEEEQMSLIAEHELVQEWQLYMQEIQAIINQKIADRDQVELEYNQVSYSYNELIKTEENTRELRELYNQCQLYAYSSEYLSADQILLNHESSLNDYLIQIDSYLNKIIATPYRKVSFSDILDLFNQQLNSEEDVLTDKTNILVDSIAFQTYAYAKEINLADVETLSQHAKMAYDNDQDIMKYGDRYRELIQLKENQWNYIYQINLDAFERLKNDLVNFLNAGHYVSEDEINLVSNLQNKNQVKLVFFDDHNQTWVVNSTGTSGYYDQYYYEELGPQSLTLLSDDSLTSESSVESTSEEISETDDETSPSSVIDDESDESIDDKLSSLKEQLSNARNNTQVKELSVPTNKEDNSSPDSSSKKSKNLELPSTGERRPITVGAILILIFGLVLILTSSYSKRKKKEEAMKVHLD